MEPHQQRVVDEKTELDGKIEKLTAFFSNPIFETLPIDEQCRLKAQVWYMAGYSSILTDRISKF